MTRNNNEEENRQMEGMNDWNPFSNTRSTLTDMLNNPDTLTDALADHINAFTMSAGVSAEEISNITPTSVTVTRTVNLDYESPATKQHSTFEAAWTIAQRGEKTGTLIEAEGMAVFADHTMCEDCGYTVTHNDGQHPEECPECNSENVDAPFVPVIMTFEETIEFENSVDTVSELKSELQTAFDTPSLEL